MTYAGVVVLLEGFALIQRYNVFYDKLETPHDIPSILV